MNTQTNKTFPPIETRWISSNNYIRINHRGDERIEPEFANVPTTLRQMTPRPWEVHTYSWGSVGMVARRRECQVYEHQLPCCLFSHVDKMEDIHRPLLPKDPQCNFSPPVVTQGLCSRSHMVRWITSIRPKNNIAGHPHPHTHSHTHTHIHTHSHTHTHTQAHKQTDTLSVLSWLTDMSCAEK